MGRIEIGTRVRLTIPVDGRPNGTAGKVCLIDGDVIWVRFRSPTGVLKFTLPTAVLAFAEQEVA